MCTGRAEAGAKWGATPKHKLMLGFVLWCSVAEEAEVGVFGDLVLGGSVSKLYFVVDDVAVVRLPK